jgi:hypothetical protein
MEVHSLDVFVPLYMGPVLLQNRTTERIDFYLPSALQPGTLQTQIHAANSGEERAKRQFPISDCDVVFHLRFRSWLIFHR